MLSVWWCDHIRNLDTSLVVFLRGICSGLGPSEGGIVYGLFSKEALFLARHLLIARTVQVWPHVSQNISGVCVDPVSKMQANPCIDFSGADYGAFVSFHSLPFPQSPKHWQRKHWRYPWRLRWAMRGMRRRNVDCVDGRPVGDGERGDHGQAFGVVRLSKKLFQTSSRASQFSFQVRWGWTFPFPLFTQLRYEKNMRIVGHKDLSICLIPAGWGYSWRIARKVRIVRTFCGSGCRGGFGGRLLHICMRHPNRFPNFLSFPPDIPGSEISPAVSFSTTEKSSSVSGASRHQEFWACQAKIPRGYW